MKRPALAGLVVAAALLTVLLVLEGRQGRVSPGRDAATPNRASAPGRESAPNPSVANGHPSATETAGARHAFTLDGGLQALDLVPEPPAAGDQVDVPVEARLQLAQEAVERFAERLARLQRERAETDDSERAMLDQRIEVARRRLAIAELAERATRAELTGRPAPSETTASR